MITLLIVVFTAASNSLTGAREVTLRDLSKVEAKQLANFENISYFNEVLDNILIQRVVGTENHKTVGSYIIKELEALDWTVEVDEFNDTTPIFGELTFKNIIATLNPNAEKSLLLACHYDSKYFKKFTFVGATDSAVPCAMLLNLAKLMKKEFDELKKRQDLTVQFVFFDGEEAFLKWGPKDSIYGARHLAKKWKTENKLNRIQLFMLLDLIGAPNPRFHCFFKNTQIWLRLLAEIEASLFGSKEYFDETLVSVGIEDDHLPFLRRGVPIVHLITYPFPKEWHTQADNRGLINIKTVKHISKILQIFVIKFFERIKPDNTSSAVIQKFFSLLYNFYILPLLNSFIYIV